MHTYQGGNLIDEFIDDVVSCGVENILPHKLADKWLKPISQASVEFLKIVTNDVETDAETFLNHEKGMLLMAAVTELLQHRYDYPAHFQMTSVPKADLYDLMSCYCIAVLMEEGKRVLDIEVPEINEDDILEKDVISDIEAKNPEISNYLFEKIS